LGEAKRGEAAVIVNGIDNPRVQCPGGTADKLELDDGLVWWPCPDSDCVLTIHWPPLEGEHTLACVNEAGASELLPISVPEPDAFLFGFFAVWLCYSLWRLLRGYDKDRKRMNWLATSGKARIFIRTVNGYYQDAAGLSLRRLVDEGMEE
jgi:hypothetical protein